MTQILSENKKNSSGKKFHTLHIRSIWIPRIPEFTETPWEEETSRTIVFFSPPSNQKVFEKQFYAVCGLCKEFIDNDGSYFNLIKHKFLTIFWP